VTLFTLKSRPVAHTRSAATKLHGAWRSQPECRVFPVCRSITLPTNNAALSRYQFSSLRHDAIYWHDFSIGTLDTHSPNPNDQGCILVRTNPGGSATRFICGKRAEYAWMGKDAGAVDRSPPARTCSFAHMRGDRGHHPQTPNRGTRRAAVPQQHGRTISRPLPTAVCDQRGLARLDAPHHWRRFHDTLITNDAGPGPAQLLETNRSELVVLRLRSC